MANSLESENQILLYSVLHGRRTQKIERYYFALFESFVCQRPRSITAGRKRPFFIVFDSFRSDRITAVFCRTAHGW